MDKHALQFYNENWEGLSEEYSSAGEGVAKYFQQSFTPGSKVLDVGCGSGRDVGRFKPGHPSGICIWFPGGV